MKPNLLLIIAIVAVVIVLVNFTITLTRIQDLRTAITGLAGTLGFVNITVNQVTAIEFTNDTLNWGPGVVNTTGGFNNATLTTAVTTASVTGGNWSTSGKRGLTIENTGNLNLSISLNSSQTAAQMFAGTAARQAFQWNITSVKGTGASGSCLNATGTGAASTVAIWYDVNTTTGQTVCNWVPWVSTQDLMSIDILLRVPDDATSTGLRSATITATATAL